MGREVSENLRAFADTLLLDGLGKELSTPCLEEQRDSLAHVTYRLIAR
jgi:hypothetical protein